MQIKREFVDAAKRAARLGLDALELHCAHGYLLHEFLSPLSNRRDDAYGGSFDNRVRFPLEVFAAVRDCWPQDKPMGVRISATDWVDGGWTIDDSIALVAPSQSRRLRLDRHVERRHLAGAEDPARSRLPGAAGARDTPRDPHRRRWR